MSEWIPRRVTSKPFTVPIPAAAINAIKIAIGVNTPAFSITTTMPAPSPRTEPTERSNSPETINMVTPTATIPSSADKSRIFDRTFMVRKNGAKIAKKMKIATAAMTTPDSGLRKSRHRSLSRASAAAVDGCCSSSGVSDFSTTLPRQVTPTKNQAKYNYFFWVRISRASHRCSQSARMNN